MDTEIFIDALVYTSPKQNLTIVSLDPMANLTLILEALWEEMVYQYVVKVGYYAKDLQRLR